MKFKFPFETLLMHRKRIEEEKQRAYALAQQNLKTCLDGINEMYQRIDEIRLEIRQTQMQGGPAAGKITSMNEFIKGQRVRIENERQKARELMQVAEEKLEILTEAAREHQILKKLKEKKYTEFKKAMRKKEQKSLDDLITMRFRLNKSQSGA